MSSPLVHAFFIGRALAETVGEELESSLTDSLSYLGRFDAEQRERLRQFVDRVMERANQAEATAQVQTSTAPDGSPASPMPSSPADLQATIDELRAEIAQLRAALQQYRNQSS
jgi:polyhydroxyalkanoate synthesis regulator phasin